MLPHQFIRIPIGRVRGRKNSFSLPAGTVKLSGLWLPLAWRNPEENSHQPTRRRERIMKRFKSPRQVQRFLSVHDQIDNVFTRHPNPDTAAKFHSVRSQAFLGWAEITAVAMAA
jgi:hypothetical protein